MPELEIGLVDGGELNINQSFLQLVFLDLILNAEY